MKRLSRPDHETDSEPLFDGPSKSVLKREAHPAQLLGEQLIALKDPYSPTDNLVYQGAFHDLILYHDHLYPAWGPSPTLLFLLIRITGYRPSDPFAVAFYCFGGLVGATALMHVLARRLVPGMPNWALSVATVGIALCNVAPFLLRRPAEELAQVTAGNARRVYGLPRD